MLVTKPNKTFALKVAAWIGTAFFLHGAMTIFLGGPIEYVVPGILIAGAVYIALVDRTPIEHGTFLKRGVALLMAVGAMWLGTPQSNGESIPWQPYSEQLVDAAGRGKRPVMIEFMTRNCPFCRRLERDVFSRQKVIAAAAEFLPLRADLSDLTAETQQLSLKYQVEGFPTVVFLDENGNEKVNLRLNGYEPAADFLQRLQSAR